MSVVGRHERGVRIAPEFRAAYAPPDEDVAARLLAEAPRAPATEQRIDARATRLIEAIRASTGGLGGIEDFLHAYSLSTKEGLALMVLAEALLRVPDAATADRLIEDKLAAGNWSAYEPKSSAFLVSASAWTLGITARIIQPGETPENILESLIKRLGLPAVRTATRQAMRLLGSHFILGQTIEEALERARAHGELRYSFDMLGEGARTMADARRYFESYAAAIAAIGARAGNKALPDRPGISVKLSALHPRFEAVSRERVMVELVPDVIELARGAKRHDLNFTVDAEEADRLELSLDVIAAALRDPSLAGWHGFGLAVQSYQKRAPQVIAWVSALAQALDRRLMVRLVKGAYWDTEIKRAQERGLADYPVFTRKAMTDLCYVACARQLLAARPRIFPQFATHNALTVAERDRGCGRRCGLRVSAPARHGRGALRGVAGGAAGGRMPGLCAGRRPPRPARLSGATSARERRQFILRLGGGRSRGADPAILKRPQEWISDVTQRPPSGNSVAARSLRPRAAQFGGRGVRRSREPGGAARRDPPRDAGGARGRAVGGWRGAAGYGTHGDIADRRHTRRPRRRGR